MRVFPLIIKLCKSNQDQTPASQGAGAEESALVAFGIHEKTPSHTALEFFVRSRKWYGSNCQWSPPPERLSGWGKKKKNSSQRRARKDSSKKKCKKRQPASVIGLFISAIYRSKKLGQKSGYVKAVLVPALVYCCCFFSLFFEWPIWLDSDFPRTRRKVLKNIC